MLCLPNLLFFHRGKVCCGKRVCTKTLDSPWNAYPTVLFSICTKFSFLNFTGNESKRVIVCITFFSEQDFAKSVSDILLVPNQNIISEQTFFGRIYIAKEGSNVDTLALPYHIGKWSDRKNARWISMSSSLWEGPSENISISLLLCVGLVLVHYCCIDNVQALVSTLSPPFE